MKARGFPWQRHRTQAEVMRTDALMRKHEAGKLLAIEADEPRLLLAKAVRHNPPAGRPGDAA